MSNGKTITTEEAIKRGLLGKTPKDVYARLVREKDPYAATYAKKWGLGVTAKPKSAPVRSTAARRTAVLPPTGRKKIDVVAGAAGRTPDRSTSPDPNADLAAAVEAWLASQQAGGGGGGIPFGSTQAGIQEEARLVTEENARQRAFQAEQDRLQREFAEQQEAQRREAERQAKFADLQTQRQAMYVDLIGRDPARAVLFALGYGPEHDTFSTQAQQLGLTLTPLAGSAETQKTTQEALSKLIGRPISIGQFGVSGLGSAEQAARAFVQGAPESQRLLGSAFQLGSTAPGAQSGISPETLMERALAVTPTGELSFR
jgi:hypothetical protein